MRSASAEVLADHNAHVEAVERALDTGNTWRELRRKWVLAARASGAARARGTEGALLAAADLRAVARRFHRRERETEQRPLSELCPILDTVARAQDVCVHCGTPHDFAAELCRECGRPPFVEVLLDDAGV